MSIEFYLIKKCVFSVQIFTRRTSCVQFGNTIKKRKIPMRHIFYAYLSRLYRSIKAQNTSDISKNYEGLHRTISYLQKNFSAQDQPQKTLKKSVFF